MKNFFFTIDVEVDKSKDWSISPEASFSSITYGLNDLLFPLLNKYNIKSTLFLSPEVLENKQCISTLLNNQSENIEYATHLHGEFISPVKTLYPDNMPYKKADKFQTEYSVEVEFQKLKNLTEKFKDIFGKLPTSFRAGRYATREETYKHLIDLGYKIDSSITPGLKWTNNNNNIDYSKKNNDIFIFNYNNKKMLCCPISIQRKYKNLNFIYNLYNKKKLNNIIFNKIFSKMLGYNWLRPAYNKNYNLINYIKKYDQENYILLMHSNEITINTSPYTVNKYSQNKLLQSLEDLFIYISSNKFNSLKLNDLLKNYSI